MEYEAERNTKMQIFALLMTVVIVGGALVYAI